MKKECSDVVISYATIYRAIYAGLLEKEKLSHGARGVARKLRHRGKKRRKKNIEERPVEANKRSELGHWEADTVAGKTGSSCMITLTDRKSRFLLLKKVSKKSAELVKQGILELLSALPPEHVRSVTPDRGKEFSRHAEITAEMDGLQFYFPKPHAPWERGTNENTNGLIREYCPKSVDLELLDESYFVTFTDKLNRRPRKCLGWNSPYEVFFDVVLHLT